MVLKDLENEGVITKYCKIWRDAGVPSAWVLHSGVFLRHQASINLSLLDYRRGQHEDGHKS